MSPEEGPVERLVVEIEDGVRIATRIGAHRIVTDQPLAGGGGDTAPAPFDLFLASLATCAGLYAARFCDVRQIPREGLGVELEVRRDPAVRGRVAALTLLLRLPEGFPARYHEAITRAVDQCAVKRHLVTPPELHTRLL